MAIGARSQSARTYLEKHLETFLGCNKDELVLHGLRALRDTLPSDTDLSRKNCSIAVVGKGQDFTILSDDDVDAFVCFHYRFLMLNIF